ncbi:MAG: hypothetical protein RL071_3116 [Pseudomonadota bacterium]
MSRVARRIAMTRLGGVPEGLLGRPPAVAWPTQDEGALLGASEADREAFDTTPRARAARHARAMLRRMEPVVMLSPRWSATERFIDDLAQDLAVGEPTVACRVVTFRVVVGRSPVECWRQTLQVLARLGEGGRRRRSPRTVADRRGFRWALDELLDEVHEHALHRTALLAHGCEQLPVEVLGDLVGAWRDYRDRYPDERRCTALFSAADTSPWLALGDRPPFTLSDYAETEALAAIVGRAGPMPLRGLERAARFTGGIPALVEKLADVTRVRGSLPSRPAELLEAFGALGEELRGAVEIANAHEQLAERLGALLDGEPQPLNEAVDRALISAGLLRPLRTAKGPQVALRAPAIAAYIG